MAKYNLTFGNLSLASYNVWISGDEIYDAPERDMEFVSVPGRNGDLLIDNGRWKNIDVTYPAFIPSSFSSNMNSFRKAICAKTGYQKIVDTHHPNEYRIGAFVNGVQADPTAFAKTGKFNLTFNCKPQRYLTSGDTPIQLLAARLGPGTLRTNYIPVNGDLAFTVSCDENDTITVDVDTYDINGDAVTTYSYSCSNEDEQTVTFTASDIYFRIKISGYSDVDGVALQIQTTTTIGGDDLAIDARLATTLELTNPTGYATKPLFEVYGSSLPRFTLYNNEGGAMYEWYEFYSDETGSDHIFLDCDMQYMYDDTNSNVTSHLGITNAESADGESLVFPEFGRDEISIQMYVNTAITAIEDGIGLVFIYPKWWSL